MTVKTKKPREKRPQFTETDIESLIDHPEWSIHWYGFCRLMDIGDEARERFKKMWANRKHKEKIPTKWVLPWVHGTVLFDSDNQFAFKKDGRQ